MSKSKNSKLGIVFGVLLIIVIVIYFTDSGKNERTFKKDIVEIDTSAVNEIQIFPKALNGKSIDLYLNDDDNWMVKYDSNKVDNVLHSKIKNVLNELINVKPKRLVSRTNKKWQEYEVTDDATRVKVFEDGSETLDLVIGKFTFQQPRTMNTYVRLGGESEVYETEGFLSMTFNGEVSGWRDGTIINSEPESWNRLAFDYPGEESFQLNRFGERWSALGGIIDSAQTVKTLRQLSKIASQKFADDVLPAQLKNPKYTITIEAKSDTIVVNGFDVGEKLILESSQNPGTYFDGNQNDIGKKLFVKLEEFYKQPDKK